MELRRLEAPDAPAFQRLRIEGFALQPREFRYAPQDEADMPLTEVAARLARDFVAGVFQGDMLVGIAGLTRLGGVKINHKALLWGMYLRAEFRGQGGADMLMSAILDHARGRVEIVTLTAMSDNPRALAFYRRWRFVPYGVEPAAVKYEGGYFDETLMSLRLA
ncbi:MAG: GNAT family N-acetyltransferase [Methylocystis sp.]